MPILHRWRSTRPHPLKRYAIQPPLIRIANIAPSPTAPAHPHNPLRLRDVRCVDLLGGALPLALAPLVGGALRLRHVDRRVRRGYLADLQVGAVERQVRVVDVRVAPCQEGLVLVDVSVSMTLLEFTQLRKAGNTHRSYSFSSARSTEGSSRRRTTPSVLVGSTSRVGLVVWSGLWYAWPCLGSLLDFRTLGGGCADIHRRTPAMILPRS